MNHFCALGSDEEVGGNLNTGEQLIVSVNCSRFSRKLVPTTYVSVQTKGVLPQPKIRNNCTWIDSLKATCTQMSTNCVIATDMAYVSVKATCKALFNHITSIEETKTDLNDINEPQLERTQTKKDHKIKDHKLN